MRSKLFLGCATAIAAVIENGKIRRVEMVGPEVNYHLNSAWPGSLSGN